jgi:hypothetical protein
VTDRAWSQRSASSSICSSRNCTDALRPPLAADRVDMGVEVEDVLQGLEEGCSRQSPATWDSAKQPPTLIIDGRRSRRSEPTLVGWCPNPGRLEEIYTIFECTSEIQRLVIARAISGMRIR